MSLIAGQDRFTELLDAGITIYSYQRAMMYNKMLLVDQQLACIGSPNFNQRSTSKDEEIALCIIDAELLTELHQQFQDDLELSQPYDLDRWQQRGRWQRLLEWVSRLVRHQT
ncbi:MAG: phospholipase D-like domain-containing protein [Thiolinea sp.]